MIIIFLIFYFIFYFIFFLSCFYSSIVLFDFHVSVFSVFVFLCFYVFFVLLLPHGEIKCILDSYLSVRDGCRRVKFSMTLGCCVCRQVFASPLWTHRTCPPSVPAPIHSATGSYWTASCLYVIFPVPPPLWQACFLSTLTRCSIALMTASRDSSSSRTNTSLST